MGRLSKGGKIKDCRVYCKMEDYMFKYVESLAVNWDDNLSQTLRHIIIDHMNYNMNKEK